MRKLLGLFPKPSHYAGIEEGAIVKAGDKVALRMALAFPDAYEVGMSYLGHKILYDIINANPAWWAERVMAPELEASEIMRARGVALATLESDTPLRNLDLIGFAVTHELCFTDVLHMLDLAGIPLRAAHRSQNLGECPIVMAGGGALLGAEPLAPFLDLAALGDGEEMLPEILALLEKAKASAWTRQEFLLEARLIPGVYVPAFFHDGEDGRLKPALANYRPGRRVVADMNAVPYPAAQVVPVGAVHNRLALEIARGCPNGCRFCHAGMVYRPLRERDPQILAETLEECLDRTGFEEISFLALSAGDYSALKSLRASTYERCARGQIVLSLPSLRVGSVDDEILAGMASMRRTGCTLAPEAGSQRLRDVINKNISEEQIINHARKLLEHGWRQVKLYFMIGLPTETDADLEGIANLCRQVRDAGGPDAPKLRVTAAISPFVPKPFTPFQWEEQIARSEIRRRVNLLLDLFKKAKGLTLRWHDPDSSYLEGILSRGGRELADVVEKAYHKGAVFCGWAEKFSLHPWLEAFAECGINPDDYLKPRQPGEPLPWDHLECGVAEKYLLRERERAHAAKTTPPCGPNSCGQCGACDKASAPSRLPSPASSRQTYGLRLATAPTELQPVSARMINAKADLLQARGQKPKLQEALTFKAAQYRVWHRKNGGFAWLSHLELQSLLDRALRRAGLPVAFSQGFHPLPLISFGRALPVGAQSDAEWFAVTLYQSLPPGEVATRLNALTHPDLRILAVEPVTGKQRTEQSSMETFRLDMASETQTADVASCFADFAARTEVSYEKTGKKGSRIMNLRPFLLGWTLRSSPVSESAVTFQLDWRNAYLSPLAFTGAVLAPMGEGIMETVKITKTAQHFASGRIWPPTAKGMARPV